MPLCPKILPAFLLASLFCATAAQGGSIVAIRGPLAPGAAAELARTFAYYGDYGYIALGEGSAAQVRELRRLGHDALVVGQWRDGVHVYVAEASFVPAAANVLLRHRTQVLFTAPRPLAGAGAMNHPIAVPREPWRISSGLPQGGMKKAAIAPDSRVSALVAQVNKANIQGTVTHLASYLTRRADQPTALVAKDWLVQQLQAIPGVSVTTDTFNAGYAPNIIAVIPGTAHPERLVIMGAHYDSIAGSGSAPAPGADDNASGSAGVLEAARVLAQGKFENTVRLMLFSAEEFGLVGSDHDASNLLAAGAQVVAMLNMDMIAYLKPGDTRDLDLATNNTDPSLTQFCIDCAAAYTPTFPVQTGVLTAGTSDHAEYQSRGFPSAFLFEDFQNYSPYIHSANDTVGTSANDFDLAWQITQVCVSAAAELARPLDLQIAHTPLPDTTNAGGPYPLAATVTSLTTDQVATVEVYYRTGTGAFLAKPLIESATANVWVGSLPGFPSGSMEYYLLATDTGGHKEWAPAAFAPGDNVYRFSVGLSTIFLDDFEAAGENGWTSVQVATQNDWQKGVPFGKAGDPSSAASGTSVRGNDLGISGYNGEYQPNVHNYLQSPSIDCSGKSGVRLRFNRWLTVEDGFYDQATVEVNGQSIWQNPATPGGGTNHTIDTAWSYQEFDISSLADNNPAVSVRFRLQSDGGLNFGGWNIDDVELFTLTTGTVAELVASEAYISASQGGQVNFAIDTGTAYAGQIYVLGMSATGTAPATVIDGTAIPLVLDAVSNVGFTFLNTPFFSNFAGHLSPNGTAGASLVLPGLSDPALPGLELYFSAFTVAPVTHATNAVIVEFGM